ncbi:MAG: excinuclease ABC subunit UvrB [Candidatus Dadabacteria bacterium]|nr:excinuclease ABC subunit UvrB [Candidatus Dadabacteria bacterium]
MDSEKSLFNLKSPFEPKGDQPRAISALCKGLNMGYKDQVLLGVTGSGKTFTIAQVIREVERPALILVHNKTLAAQIYAELHDFFPDNEVHYFVSYYDYYQPEAYIPETDTYIEKDASINEYIDRMRHAATKALFRCRDVIVVSSVSAIYGIGAPKVYYGMLTEIEVGMELSRDDFALRLEEVRYERKIDELERGTYRVRGDVVDVFPSHEESTALRVEFFGDSIETIRAIDPLTGKAAGEIREVSIFPGSHYVAPKSILEKAVEGIGVELEGRLSELRGRGMELEASRLEERTRFDLELLDTMGFCPGIENYSRYISGRSPGQAPYTLLDYFPEDFLCVIDESHQMIPQLRGMYLGDRSRKLSLVENGFRLPSAFDNRPLNFEEFGAKIGQVIYVSATPGPYEVERARDRVVEQIIRPTGLADPLVEIRSAHNQVDDLFDELKKVAASGHRALVTTLTKKMAEDLSDYYREFGLRVEYLHSEIDTLERIRIIRDLRAAKFDVLVGINLLREGLDIPEVSLVAVLDADKEGYLRSETSLIQIFGRAARNVSGRVILYADVITGSMSAAMNETRRRRNIQMEYNDRNNIVPRSIEKSITDVLGSIYESDYLKISDEQELPDIAPNKIPETIAKLSREMKSAAKKLEFEKAAEFRNRIRKLQDLEIKYAEGVI